MLHIIHTITLSKWALNQPARSTDYEKSVREMHRMIDQVIRQTRSLTMELSPPLLHELGFEAAVDWLAEHMTTQHGMLFQAHITG